MKTKEYQSRSQIIRFKTGSSLEVSSGDLMAAQQSRVWLRWSIWRHWRWPTAKSGVPPVHSSSLVISYRSCSLYYSLTPVVVVIKRLMHHIMATPQKPMPICGVQHWSYRVVWFCLQRAIPKTFHAFSLFTNILFNLDFHPLIALSVRLLTWGFSILYLQVSLKRATLMVEQPSFK